ncbi:MAG: glycosyltransferase family 4 protein [Longimicrobiales bacterium]|nr:glycosyltransferase family 4 protein [Longimicrobiales bacterium]
MPRKSPTLHLIGPGSLDRPTGGDRYDARMVTELRSRGWDVAVHGLEGEYPRTDGSAANALDEVLAGLPDGARALVDGLVLGGLPDPTARHSGRVRMVALVHHPLADETGLTPVERARLTETERRALEAVDGVVVTSRHTAERVREGFGVPRERIRVVQPGTDPAPIARGPGPDEPPGLLCLGSLIPRKGQDVLVAALAELRDLPWSLVCAGSITAAPAFARKVRSSAHEAGIADRIRLPGTVSDETVNELFDTSSLFVLPSRHEGYGMALTEALARGLPIVTTTAGAIPETVPADASLRIPPGDPDALAKALASLLGPGGTERRRKLARAARLHGTRLPTWDEAAAALARAVVELTGAPGVEPGVEGGDEDPPSGAPSREPREGGDPGS